MRDRIVMAKIHFHELDTVQTGLVKIAEDALHITIRIPVGWIGAGIHPDVGAYLRFEAAGCKRRADPTRRQEPGNEAGGGIPQKTAA